MTERRAFLYTLNGKRPEACLDVIRWARWMESYCRQHNGAPRVAADRVGEYFVSTVFLGVDHGWLGSAQSPPILFETMVFDRSEISAGSRRYSTWEEAEAGHAEIVERLREGER